MQIILLDKIYKIKYLSLSSYKRGKIWFGISKFIKRLNYICTTRGKW